SLRCKMAERIGSERSCARSHEPCGWTNLNKAEQHKDQLSDFFAHKGSMLHKFNHRLKEVYGEQCLARCTIFRWCQRYEAGRVNIKDFPRPGQARVMTNSATISAVDDLIPQNRRITTREIAVELSISKGTVHHVIHKKLGYGKVCAQWVLKLLSENQKTARMGVCLTQEFLH
ncbi:hypothetical protein AVEN_247397-1, partial [Araneus ventricosus]